MSMTAKKTCNFFLPLEIHLKCCAKLDKNVETVSFHFCVCFLLLSQNQNRLLYN